MRVHYYILTLLLSLNFALTHAADMPKRELRAVWLTTLNGLDWPQTKATSATTRQQQQQELCLILDQLKAANINTVLLQTRVRGSVIYPSDIEPWDVALTGRYGGDPGYDPLRFAIAEAHRRGMELHAWVVTIPCFKQAVARQMGKRSVLGTHPSLCRRHDDMWYLDPGLPGTADYLAAICREIVSRYDVDGIHFDYIRYPEGAATFNDAATYRRYGGGRSKAAWRRNNITRIVRRIYEETHAAKSWVRVSSSPVGKYADLSRFPSRGWNARDAVHQDAEGWLRQGIHDILFPMMYFDGNHFYPFAADWQEQSCGRLVAPGLGIYFMDPSQKDWPLSAIQRQLSFLRSEGLAGQCYFRSRFLTDNTKGLYNYLRDVFYAFPALPPACTWLVAEGPEAPTAPSINAIDEQTAELTWHAQMPGTTSVGDATDAESTGSPTDAGTGNAGTLALRYNVYVSRQWPVDISRAEHLVATLLPEARFRFNRIAALPYYFAVTAIDRAGNESSALQVSEQPHTIQSKKLQLDSRGHVIGLIDRPTPSTAKAKKKKKRRK